jgi:hypothetical protein
MWTHPRVRARQRRERESLRPRPRRLNEDLFDDEPVVAFIRNLVSNEVAILRDRTTGKPVVFTSVRAAARSLKARRQEVMDLLHLNEPSLVRIALLPVYAARMDPELNKLFDS